jgi:hypothetical protein
MWVQSKTNCPNQAIVAVFKTNNLNNSNYLNINYTEK